MTHRCPRAIISVLAPVIVRLAPRCPRVIVSILVLTITQLSLPNSAIAGTATANLDVLAMVNPSCSVTTAAVDFGAIDPTQNVNFLATGTLMVICTAGTSWLALADDGLSPTTFPGLPDSTQRNMIPVSGSGVVGKLKYLLFKDSARTSPWQNAFGFTGVGTGSAQNNVVYGTIPNGQTGVSAASYKDTVVVTVSY